MKHHTIHVLECPGISDLMEPGMDPESRQAELCLALLTAAAEAAEACGATIDHLCGIDFILSRYVRFWFDPESQPVTVPVAPAAAILGVWIQRELEKMEANQQ